MEQDTEVVPRGQGSPNSPHKKGTGTHINPEGGSLQAVPARGQGNTNTSTTGKYHGRTPGRREDCSGSADTTDGTVGRNICHEGRTLESMDKGGNQGKIPRH